MDPVFIIVAVTLFAAAFLQSATGFGMAIVLMAVLPMIVTVEEASAFTSLGSMIVTVFVIAANRSGLSFRDAGPLVLGMCIGIPVGFFGLRMLDGEIIIRVLGIVLIAITVIEFLQNRIKHLSIPENSGTAFGFAGGVLAGSFNVGGPPLVVYAYSRGWSKVTSVAVLQTAFLAGGVIRNSLVAGAGEFTPALLKLIAFSMPTAILAVWLGKKTLDRVPQLLLKKIVFVMIFLIGLRYLILG